MKMCNVCGKHAKELDTPWQRFKFQILQTFFRWEIRDIEQSFYSKGVADGFIQGCEYAKTENQAKQDMVLNATQIREQMLNPSLWGPKSNP